ncbi:MAG: bifunctional phosphoglucose/phosphomannose isomerase [Candidatus Zixiibacteriota bacterium]
MHWKVEKKEANSPTALSLLDSVEKIRSFDPENMYNHIFDFPEQMARAQNIGISWKINAGMFPDIRNIVLVGMGGSAIGGDLARSLLNGKLEIPFHVCRHYKLPEFVDDETLVIASSYSGNTEETLSALDDALDRKAMIAAISTGGMMQDVCKLNGIPMATLPAGMQPRAALGFSFVPLLIFLEKVKLIPGMSDDINHTIERLKTYRQEYIEDSPVKLNPAKKLAERLQGRIVVVYSGPSLTDAVAVRWKGQICENAKTLAFANQFAEFNHNELVGWSDLTRQHSDKLIVVILRDKDDHAQIKKRMDIVKPLIEDSGTEVIEVESRGTSDLERMFSLIQIGDFVSYYLAILNKQDPTPVITIEMLKAALADKDV